MDNKEIELLEQQKNEIKKAYFRKYYLEHKEHLKLLPSRNVSKEKYNEYNKRAYLKHKNEIRICPDCQKTYNYYSYNQHKKFNRCYMKIYNE